MSQKPKTDEQLTELIRKGELDESAWTDIFSQYQKLIYGIISQSVWQLDRDEWDDIAQNIRIEFLRAIPKFRGENEAGKPCTLRSYLHKVAVRRCIKESKKKPRERNMKQAFIEKRRGLGDDLNLPMVEVLKNEHESAFMEVWAGLNEDLQFILYMKYINGASYQEIESLKGIRSNTLRKKVKRTLEQLKKKLKRNGILSEHARLGIRKLMEDTHHE
jgi:RNA polymerase sigma factor (sigma-70 family)